MFEAVRASTAQQHQHRVSYLSDLSCRLPAKNRQQAERSFATKLFVLSQVTP
jgi:hypothetical protein